MRNSTLCYGNVLAIIACSDLYHCLPWSHGSLGFLVSLTLDIIPVKAVFRILILIPCWALLQIRIEY